MVVVSSSQFNYKYRGRLHFPYSIAMSIAFVKSKEELNNNFSFEKCFVIRDKINEYIEQCKNSEILLCSCYVWNWEITNYLARKVKENNPNCFIIFGGPQVPNPVLETDPVKWSWATVFIGRPSQKYKFHSKFLKEEILVAR